MRTVVSIFTSRAAAEHAADQLRGLGIAREQLHFLIPGAAETQLTQAPTTDTEQPGMGPALGGVVGGALGASGGLMTTAVLSALIPGIGPITAIGIAAISLIGGVGGVLAGAAAGNALENAMSDGLPKDELFVYEDALRQGRTVLMVLAEDDPQAAAVRTALAGAGAESVDAARDQWWIGLRDAEAEAYEGQGREFMGDEAIYRCGFEAALHAEAAGKPYTEVGGYLQARYAEVYGHTAFRRGYERGRTYYAEVQTRRQG